MDVDYGRNKGSMPPSAPNAARRGQSFESLNDLPEPWREEVLDGLIVIGEVKYIV